MATDSTPLNLKPALPRAPGAALGFVQWRAEVYTPSTKPNRGLQEVSYRFHDRDILVTSCSRIRPHRKRINLSLVFAGQTLGIKEVEDGIWLVSFMHYDLEYFDLEQRTLQPLDNPFGPRL